MTIVQIGKVGYAIWEVDLGNMGKSKEINGKQKSRIPRPLQRGWWLARRDDPIDLRRPGGLPNVLPLGEIFGVLQLDDVP